MVPRPREGVEISFWGDGGFCLSFGGCSGCCIMVFALDFWMDFLGLYDLAERRYYINLAMDPSVSSGSVLGDKSFNTLLGATAQ